MLRAAPLEPDTRLRNILTVYLDDESHYSLLKARQLHGGPLTRLVRDILRLWLVQNGFMPYPQLPAMFAAFAPSLPGPQPQAPPIPQTPLQAAPVNGGGGRSRHG